MGANQMLTNVRYIILTALRDWLFAALMAGMLAAAMIAHVLGGTALAEPQAMTICFVAGSVRVVIVTGLIVFVCFHVQSAFDTKEIDVFLSRPITRSSLVFSYWLGFACVSLLLLVPTFALVVMQGILNAKGLACWAASFLVECGLMVAISLLAAFTLRSAIMSVMISLGFYTFARMIGFFITTGIADFLPDMHGVNAILSSAFEAFCAFMPRLDALGRSEWLVYGVRAPEEFLSHMTLAVALIPLCILVTIVDFRRRQF